MNYINEYRKYRFLMSQLVSRDFKTKYKRSILGILWSLLNPLLMMMVQYIVFSTLFRFDIQYYAVYLLIGLVFFNFMSEATNQALISLTGNAALLTKVRIPLYVFPVSKVLSASINMGFSFITLYFIIFVSGLPLNWHHLLLPFPILCTFLFTIGMSLVLASLMVFFRDIQHLYGIFIQIWMYLTPLFYPETIMPPQYMWIMEINPMYHFIRYARGLILSDVTPTLRAHIFCLIFSLGMLLIGYLVFKSTKKKIIFNI